MGDVIFSNPTELFTFDARHKSRYLLPRLEPYLSLLVSLLQNHNFWNRIYFTNCFYCYNDIIIFEILEIWKRLNQVSPREVVLSTCPSVRRARKRLWEYLFPLLVWYYVCLGPILTYFFFTSFIKPIPNTIDAHLRNQQYVKIIDIFTTCGIITDPLIYFVKTRVSKT